MSGVQARCPPSHHQRSPSPFLLDSFNFTPHTCHSSYIPSCSPSLWTIYSHHFCPSAWLDYSHLHMFMYMYHCSFSSHLSMFTRTPALCCHLWCPFLCRVLFFACWPFCLLKDAYLHLDPDLCSSSVPSLNVP